MSDATNPAVPQLPDISTRVVLLKWSRTRFSNKRREKNAVVEGGADKRMTTVHKRLLTSPAYGRILGHDTYVTAYLGSHACQTGLFGRSGVYAVPLSMLSEIHAQLTMRKEQREILVREFVASYADDIQRTEAQLGDLFNPADYPTPEALAASFSCGWSFMALGMPDTFADLIEPAIFDAEQKKARAMFERIAGDVRDVLRVGLSKLVDGMLDRLQPAADGKRKAIHETFLQKFGEFVAVFDARNVTDDAELAALVQQARALVDGNDIDAWRKDDAFRNDALRKFEAINDQLQGWVVEANDRMIDLDDEEAVA